jgi:hypothetical protein
VARWALCYLFVIACATAGVYGASNQLVAANSFQRAEYAMLPLGQLGSPACAHATRGLVAAADGSAPDATPVRRDAYELAAAAVLAACTQG